MVRTLLTTCALNESLLARKYPVIISWTWSFLVGQKHRTARARIAEEDVYLMKIATSLYQLNYLRQEVKDVRCINIFRGKNLPFAPELLGKLLRKNHWIARSVSFVRPSEADMCAQVADHSRFMDALGELHAKGHSPRDSQQVQ